MRRHWAYLKYVLRHKWYVYQYGRALGLGYWQLFWHDWSKFLPIEWIPYAHCFYNDDGTKRYQPTEDFMRVWNQHTKINKHHWQYWILVLDSGEEVVLPMPHKFILEMVADWRGAGHALGKTDTVGWYKNRQDTILLHPDTRYQVEVLLGLNPLRERLAALAHQQWSDWMGYMLKQGTLNQDGTWTMPAWAYERWTRQKETPYEELPGPEQISDLAEADRMLSVLNQ